MEQVVTNSIPAPLNDLLVKLKIISMIERGKKINIGAMTFVDANSWIGAGTRNLSGENRKGLMIYLYQLVDQAITAIADYRDTEFCKLIVNGLAQAKIGIINLGTTYRGDPHVIAQINICVENIDLQLEKNKHLLEGHRNKINLSTSSEPKPEPKVQPLNLNPAAAKNTKVVRNTPLIEEKLN